MIKRFAVFIMLFAMTIVSACQPSIQSSIPDLISPQDNPTEKEELKTKQSQFKTDLRHATAFTVEYRDGYKYLTVTRPWRNAAETFSYILVQRGDPLPAEHGDAQIIEVPVRNIASLAATHLAYLTELNDLDKLIAIANPQYISGEAVQTGINAGKIQAVGNGPDVNLEKLLSLQPDLVTTFAMGNTNKDDFAQLMSKGIKTVVFSDYMEETPLGRAEWIKFMALFFNQEEEAEAIFSAVEARYEALRTKMLSISYKPTVLMGNELNGKWSVPGGKSYAAILIRDAGGSYLWEDDNSSGRIPYSFEAVLEKGAQADYWLNQSLTWETIDDINHADQRYHAIRAYDLNHIYNNNARLSEQGGNEYNETGIVNPDRILADIIAILHPDLLTEHKIYYYRHLDTGAQELERE